eukprot:COSAG01_NODE_7166_length_3322_cov_2.681353_1_plen_48_part_10
MHAERAVVGRLLRLPLVRCHAVPTFFCAKVSLAGEIQFHTAERPFCAR